MSAPSPIAGMLARQLIQRLAGGAGGPGGPPPGMAPGGPQPVSPDTGNQAGQQVASQLAELQGADPQSTLKMLQQVKSVLVALYPRTAFSLPGVARNLAQSQKYIDNAIKEAEQGAATMNTVQSPIANNAGQPQQGPSPDQGGMGLQQFAMGAQ